MRIFRGLTFMALLILAAISFLLLLLPSLILLPVPIARVIKWRRVYHDYLSNIYLEFVSAMVMHPWIGGTKIMIYTKTPQIIEDRGALLLCNHRTRVDYIYGAWCYASLLNSTSNGVSNLNSSLRFILKDSLKSVPVFGWVMQTLLYVFVSRNNKDADVGHIGETTEYLCNSGERPTMFLFPEGTDLSPSNKAKNKEYAEKEKLPVMDYVLYPKVAGLLTLLNSLRGRGAALHDITIAYTDHTQGKRTNEKMILMGQMPTEIHLCVRRFDVDQVPNDRQMLKRWLEGSFGTKERLLRSFYENNSKVPLRPVVDPNSQSTSTVLNTPEVEYWPKPIPLKVDLVRPLCIGFLWILCLIVGLTFISWVRWLLVILCIVCTAVRGFFNGFDAIELSLHRDMMENESKMEQSDSSQSHISQKDIKRD